MNGVEELAETLARGNLELKSVSFDFHKNEIKIIFLQVNLLKYTGEIMLLILNKFLWMCEAAEKEELVRRKEKIINKEKNE